MATLTLCPRTIVALMSAGFLDPRTVDCNGNTLLHIALEQNNESLARAIASFYKKHPDKAVIEEAINMANEEGDTPLHLAARHYHRNPLLLDLEDAGAKLGVVNLARQVVVHENEVKYDETLSPELTSSVTPSAVFVVQRQPVTISEIMPEISSATLPDYLTFEDNTVSASDVLAPLRRR